MNIPFIGEIQIFGFGFAPPGWALCDGSLVDIKAYPGLFSLIGTSYGGASGQFRLPNLAGRAVCGHGASDGAAPRQPGDSLAAAMTGTQPHDHRQPFVALHFYIALRGDMPAF